VFGLFAILFGSFYLSEGASWLTRPGARVRFR
jgi:hypothetical protein